MRAALRSVLHFAGCLCLLLALASTSSAVEWKDFNAVDISGIDVATVGNLTCTAALGNNATVSIGGKTYSILAIRGFYAVSQSQGTSIIQTPSTPSGTAGWNWDGDKQDAIGWHAQGTPNNITSTSGGKTFAFPSLNSTPTVWGFHLLYKDSNGAQQSYWAKDGDPASTVPEPSSMLALIGSLGGMVGLRRLRRS